jgi:hypothetical protein
MKPLTDTARLISIDGVSASAVQRAATQLARANRRVGTSVSLWDASGIFGDLEAAGSSVARPSVRTLLLLYAADLAFRLRWEIRPALAEGRSVVAAPYVDTAIALGRASGLEDAWLRRIFEFAPVPTERSYVEGKAAWRPKGPGLLEFACRALAGMETRSARQDLITRAHARIKATRHRCGRPRRRTHAP